MVCLLVARRWLGEECRLSVEHVSQRAAAAVFARCVALARTQSLRLFVSACGRRPGSGSPGSFFGKTNDLAETY